MAVLTAEEQKTGKQLKEQDIVIRTYDLWKTYTMGGQKIHAVSGVDVEINKGECGARKIQSII